jgi:hypothetical protein
LWYGNPGRLLIDQDVERPALYVPIGVLGGQQRSGHFCSPSLERLSLAIYSSSAQLRIKNVC